MREDTPWYLRLIGYPPYREWVDLSQPYAPDCGEWFYYHYSIESEGME